MGHQQREDDRALLVDVDDDPVVTDPVAPQPGQPACQALASRTGVLKVFDLAEVRDDAPRDGLVEAGELARGPYVLGRG